MDPQLCMDLLKAHCLVEKHKDWFHPPTSQDMDQSVKQWLFTWNMWSMIEGMTEAMLPVIIQEIYEVKEQEQEKKQAELMDMFQVYRKEVKTSYFNSVWYNPYGTGTRKVSKEVLWNRAKRYVFRFVNHIEQKKLPYFPLYPGCFWIWLLTKTRSNGTLGFGKGSMYPAEGMEPPQVMTRWETQNCPWYMYTPSWNEPFNQFERNARKTVDRKLIPFAVFNGV
jgi:hypothetical protein